MGSRSLVGRLAALRRGHCELCCLLFAVCRRVGGDFAVHYVVFGGNWDPQGLNLHLFVGPDHGERAPAFLLILHLLDDYLVQLVGPEGHLIDDIDDLVIALLFILIVFRKQVQEGREAILVVF